MDDATKKQHVGEMCMLTGCSAEEATFFLESSDYNLNNAAAQFFEAQNQPGGETN